GAQPRCARRASTTTRTAFTIPTTSANAPKTSLPVPSSTTPSPTKNAASTPRSTRIARSRSTTERVRGSGRGEDLHLPSLVAFAPRHDVELHPLPLLEAPEAVARDRRVVHEHVALAGALDEPEALAGVEPLDRAARPFVGTARPFAGTGRRASLRWRCEEL